MREAMISNIIKDLKAKGVKVRDYGSEGEKNLKDDLRLFINTLVAVATLTKDDTHVGGYALVDYKVSDLVKAFVIPRGVYESEKVGALNLMKDAYTIEGVDMSDSDAVRSAIMNPISFKIFQERLLSSMRTSASMVTNLADASKSVTRSDVLDRQVVEGKVRYTEETILPLKFSYPAFEMWSYVLNYDSVLESYITERITKA